MCESHTHLLGVSTDLPTKLTEMFLVIDRLLMMSIQWITPAVCQLYEQEWTVHGYWTRSRLPGQVIDVSCTLEIDKPIEKLAVLLLSDGMFYNIDVSVLLFVFRVPDLLLTYVRSVRKVVFLR